MTHRRDRRTGLLLASLAAVSVIVTALVLWTTQNARRKAHSADSHANPEIRSGPAANSALGETRNRQPKGEIVSESGHAHEETMAQLRDLLKRRHNEIRFKDVPQLDASIEEALIRQYEAESSFTRKFNLLKILILGHGKRAGEMAVKALTEREQTEANNAEEIVAWGFLPALLGIVAREDDQALQFLLQGTTLGFWERLHVWLTQEGPVTASTLRGSCVMGLAVCEHLSAKGRLLELQNNIEDAVRLGLAGALHSAAHKRDLVDRVGLEAAFDNVIFAGIDEAMRAFLAWGSTPNGLWWAEWGRRAREFEVATRTTN